MNEKSTLGMKQVPQVWNKSHRDETITTCMKKVTQVWNKFHSYETSTTGMNQVSQVWNKYTTGMKQVSRVWNKCHRYEISTTCMKQQLCIAWVDIINRTFQRDLRVNYCLNSSHSKIWLINSFFIKWKKILVPKTYHNKKNFINRFLIILLLHL